jgi:hypothetical protein
MCKSKINIKIEKLKVFLLLRGAHVTFFLLLCFIVVMHRALCACKFLQVAIGCFVLGFGKKLHIAKCAL